MNISTSSQQSTRRIQNIVPIQHNKTKIAFLFLTKDNLLTSKIWLFQQTVFAAIVDKFHVLIPTELEWVYILRDADKTLLICVDCVSFLCYPQGYIKLRIEIKCVSCSLLKKKNI